MMFTHIGKEICLTQSADSNTDLSQKHPHRHIHSFKLNIGAPCGRVKLSYKINHYTAPRYCYWTIKAAYEINDNWRKSIPLIFKDVKICPYAVAWFCMRSNGRGGLWWPGR